MNTSFIQIVNSFMVRQGQIERIFMVLIRMLVLLEILLYNLSRNTIVGIHQNIYLVKAMEPSGQR